MHRRLIILIITGFSISLFGGCATTPISEPVGKAIPNAKKIEKTSPSAIVMAVNADPKVSEARKRCEKEITSSKIMADNALKPIQVHACMYALRPALASCASETEKDVTLKIIVSKNGSIKNAVPIGGTTDGPEAKCMAKIVKNSELPSFTGDDEQIIKYPFTFSELSPN